MKYLLIVLAIFVIFLIIRLMDKENPLISNVEETDLEYIESYKPESRPDNVPDESVWRGGPDGGVYIVLPTLIQGTEDIYYAEIYNDFTGDLRYKGRLKFVYSEYAKGPHIDPTRGDINMGWSGKTLSLGDSGQYLEALDLSEKDR